MKRRTNNTSGQTTPGGKFAPSAAVHTREISEVFGQDYVFDMPQTGLAPVKRVALFAESFFPRFDGVAQHVYNTLRYLQQSGREVLVFAPDDAPRRVGPSSVVGLPSFGVPAYSDLRVGLPAPEISRQLDRFQPDLIHLFAPVCFSASGVAYGRARNIPLVAGYETDLPCYAAYYGVPSLQGLVQVWLRYLHNRCDLTLAPSQYTLRQLQQAGYTHLNCWQNGVNDQRFNPGHYSEAWRVRLLNGRASSSLLCIYVGRLAGEKNIDALLDIAKMPGVALTIIGDGPHRPALERLFEGTQTYFTGCLFGQGLAAAFASADVFVFPSTTETFGLVTVEAMASGLPALICNRGGGADLVTNGKSGFVCESPQAFVEPLGRLLDDAALRIAMSHQARQEALNYAWNRAMTQLEAYYGQAVALAAARHVQPTRIPSLLARHI